MPEIAPSSVTTIAELKMLVGDDEERTFIPSRPLTGQEHIFYEPTKPGEYEWYPKWTNRLDHNASPRPPVFDWSPRLLSQFAEGQFEFKFDTTRSALGSFYERGVGVYFISDHLCELLHKFDPGSFETLAVRFRSPGGEPIPGFRLAMPTRVLEGIDISKTEIRVSRGELYTNAGKFHTYAHFDKGYVISDSVPQTVNCFIDRYAARWLWRDSVVAEIAKSGILGIRCVHTFKRGYANEVRFVDPSLEDHGDD